MESAALMERQHFRKKWLVAGDFAHSVVVLLHYKTLMD